MPADFFGTTNDVTMLAHRDQLKSTAEHLYYQTARLTGLDRLWWKLRRRTPEGLFSLSAVCESCELSDRHYLGTQVVPLNEIQGSENRPQDFDRAFRPLKHHTRGRWMSVAMQNLRGVELPPVDLIRVGDVYFVRDGHHRVSVARALGRKEIRAEVTVWEVACWLPLPWHAADQPQG